MKCLKCGNEAQDDAIFCDQCGNRLKPVEAAPAPSAPAETMATLAQSSQPAEMASTAAAGAPPPAAALPEAPTGPVNVCPSCGHNNTPGEVFCSECGTRLAAPTPEPAAAVEAAATPAPVAVPAAGTCPVCGAGVAATDDFCDACGADLHAQGAAPAAPAPAPATPAPQPQTVTEAAVQAPVTEAAPPSPEVATKCPTCGAATGPDDTFCQNCGAALVAGAATAVAAPAAASAPVAPAATPAQPAFAPPGTGPRLVVADSGVELPLKSGQETLVGREDPTSGVFPDIDLSPHGGMEGGVSRRHFKITFVGGRYVIEDLNSTNYTMLNRQRVQPGQATPLTDGDEIRAGRVRLVFRERA